MPFMVLSIENYGWRITLIIIGILFMVFGPIIASVIRKKPNLEVINK